ncbi:EAL domain-containing protein [Simiduia agarivorans]|uniref:cyclic-guanylate-specific phosphodiesterase n=1 Tax=Simiduia agarivorans (strain DSM 21679 / JCM 13881 / BCRC 17597 / SA1) TaxID=1117647 RepID=K4KM56_SIMAS|nr:EAL domain-containing protein [Simiduia agarivorans]AFU99310.1 PAS/PAC sensor-containing diguanylate cyclase/phosphodiesterase [Simiduia agarivorans SA1 = DSM 21679]
MLVPKPHIDASHTLAEACALIVSSGADGIVVDNAQSEQLLTLAHLRDLLAHQHLTPDTPLSDVSIDKDLPHSIQQRTALSPEVSPAQLLELLHALVSDSSDAIYIKAEDGRYLLANQQFANLLGCSLENVIGAYDSDLMPTAMARNIAITEQRILSSGKAEVSEEPMATPTGMGRYLRILGSLNAGGGAQHLYGVLRDISDLREAQAARDATESELETIFRSLPDLFFRLGADGTILDYRAQEDDDLYAPPEQFLGKRMQDIIPEPLAQLFDKKIDELRSHGELVTYEYDMELPQGLSHFEARLRDLPGTDELILIIRNTTDIHQKTEALQSLQQQLNLALEAAQQGVWDWNVPSQTWVANERFFTMLGFDYDAKPQPLDYWNDKVHPDDRDKRSSLYLKAMRGDAEALEVEFRAQSASGEYRWLRAKGKVVERTKDGRAKRLVGTHEDITERKALQEQLALAAMVYENTSEGVIIADPNGIIVDVNTGFERITGYDKREVVGKPASILNSDNHSESFYQSFWDTLNQNGHWQGEIVHRRKDGTALPEWLTASAVYDHNHAIRHFVAIFTDITVLKKSEAKLDHIAHHDSLTGLPNRLLLQARLGRALVHASRNQQKLALMFLDVDRFKNVNDSLGHNEGDKLLKQVANRLKHSVRNEDTVARLGGDEFVILLESLHDTNAAAQVADKILKEIRQPFNLGGKQFYTSASIGISIYPEDGTSPSDIMRNADTAMYQVKQRGRDGYAFYARHLTTAAMRKAEMEAELHKAITGDELLLLFQPQIDLDSEQLVGVEALVRWMHPVKKMIAPDLFIPLAEESNLIIKLGEWVLNRACRQINEWQDMGLTPVPVAINVSGVELYNQSFADSFREIMATHGINPQLIKVEVTENHMLEDMDSAIQQLNKLRELGIKIAIDDFGTGYSSLAYLKKLPIHQLKIDRSFIKDIPQDVNDMAITRAVIAMGATLGMEIIAEGVETREQQKFLQEHQCGLGQGYLFARPLDAKSLENWLDHS